MNALPQPEAILLEINQSLGLDKYQTQKKEKFATLKDNLESHYTMGQEIIENIFHSLDMNPLDAYHVLQGFQEFSNAYKYLEFNVWTFSADSKQVIWSLLGHFYIPSLARRLGFWNLGQSLAKDMPDGHFWYLPEPCILNGEPTVYMPVAQVVDWLLDLLGMPVEKFADHYSELDNNAKDGFQRSLYKWKKSTPIRKESIEKYFSDDTILNFKGAFTLDKGESLEKQFSEALIFVKSKNLDAVKLRMEIPMTQAGRLECILNGDADHSEKEVFIRCLHDRYAVPSLKTIRQRFLVARAVQDGYIRLLKFLCPSVDRLCPDPKQNKVLQLFAIYKLIYNLTIDAWRHNKDQGKMAEYEWFEAHLPEPMKHFLFLCVQPLTRPNANKELSHWLTRRFFDMQSGAELEDYIELDPKNALPIIERDLTQFKEFSHERHREVHLIEKMKTSSPWRALEKEDSFWVVSQLALNPNLNDRGKEATIGRLHHLAASPSQEVYACCIELGRLLNCDSKSRSDYAQAQVQALIDKVETSKGYPLWKSMILNYKAKHLLAQNDFQGARQLFKEALECVQEHNYGTLRGEIARDSFALDVANQKLITNNHERYYKEMLAGGVIEVDQSIPSIEEIARWVSEYFWSDLYHPYPGFNVEGPRSKIIYEQLFNELLPLIIFSDKNGLKVWIKKNSNLMRSHLPDVDGNSVLMALIKLRSGFVSNLPEMRQHCLEQRIELQPFEAMLDGWRFILGIIAQESPKQLNIPDLKGQTPLMLMAEEGDAKMVKVFLDAGANPDMQDHQGMTALHSACKSYVNECVDALLDHPCALDVKTKENRSPLHTATWAGDLHAVERLVKLAPELVWMRDVNNMTPLELAESLVENPSHLTHLNQRRSLDGKVCASKQGLEFIVTLLETVEPVDIK